VRHVVTENARVEATVAALEAGELAAVGQHLTASHASMRDDYEVTTAGLDLAVEAAVGAGALGGRMTGGGFGGSALLLAGTAQAAQVAAAVTAAFATAGFAPPAITQVTPGPGAHREPVTTRENLNR
jgi:galactokinase